MASTGAGSRGRRGERERGADGGRVANFSLWSAGGALLKRRFGVGGRCPRIRVDEARSASPEKEGRARAAGGKRQKNESAARAHASSSALCFAGSTRKQAVARASLAPENKQGVKDPGGRRKTWSSSRALPTGTFDPALKGGRGGGRSGGARARSRRGKRGRGGRGRAPGPSEPSRERG